MDGDLKIINERKKILLAAIGRVVNKKRLEIKKGINKFSFEYDIGNGLLSRLERGDTDTQITTLWKIANAFEMDFSKFIALVEAELPEDFNFYN